MDEDELNPGILDSFLAPFGQELVNPGGVVTDMMGYQDPVTQPVQPAPQEYVAPAQSQEQLDRSIMEQAAAQARPRNGLSGWNPFRLMFGDPLAGAQAQPNPTNFGKFTQNASYDYPEQQAAIGMQGSPQGGEKVVQPSAAANHKVVNPAEVGLSPLWGQNQYKKQR